MGRLEDKVVIITGASSGIGAKAAEIFGREGAKLALGARRTELLEQSAQKALNAGAADAIAVTTDLREVDQCDALVDAALKRYGRVDVLVNDAGIIELGLHPVDAFTDDELERIVETNLKGTMRMTRSALRAFNAQGTGNIVTVASIAAINGCGAGVYSAAKGGLVSMTKHIAMRYANRKPTIRANCVCPATVWTDMTRQELAAQPHYNDAAKAFSASVGKHTCMDVGICKSIDVANVLLFLASDESACLNGQVMTLDYGYGL